MVFDTICDLKVSLVRPFPQLFAEQLMSYLYYLCLIEHSGVQHVFTM